MIATQPGSFGRIKRAYPSPSRPDAKPPSLAERIRAVASFRGWMPMSDCPEPRHLRNSAEARRKAADLMLADPVVKAGFLQKVLGVAQLDVSVTPDDAKMSADRDAAEFCQYAVTRKLSGGVRGFVESVLTALLPQGVVLCEPVWRTQANGSPELESRGRWKGKRTLKAIKPKPPDSYELQVDDFRNVTAVRCPSVNNTKIDYPPKQFIILSYLPQYNDPQGWNDLEAAYKAFLIKQDATRLRAVSQSNFAGPFLVAKSDDPTSSTLKTALYEARGCGFITLGSNDDVQVLSLAGADDDQFARGIQDCDRQILIGIVGAYLHILEGQVADAAGNTREHRGIAELFQWHLAALIGSVLTEQLGPILVDENFAGAGYPLWKLEGIDPADQQQRLALGQQAQALGAKLSLKQVYETSGWRPPEDEADTLGPPEPAAPPGGGGGFPFSEDFCGGKGGKPGPCPEGGKEGSKKGTAGGKKDIPVADHPRDESGKIITPEEIEVAKTNPQKAAELWNRVDGKDSIKLDNALKQPPGAPQPMVPTSQPVAPPSSQPSVPTATPADTPKLKGVKAPDNPQGFPPDAVDRKLGSTELKTVKKSLLETSQHLEKPQQQAVRSYTGKKYGEINAELRAGKTDGVHAKTIQNLKTAIDNAPTLAEPITTYRGVSLSPDQAAQFKQQLRQAAGTGGAIEFQGFASSSADMGTAVDFSKSAGKEGFVFEIAAKKGVYADPFSKFDEQEFIMNHGSKFKVLGTKRVKYGGVERPVVQLEQVVG